MSTSKYETIRGADHRANSAASYAMEESGQAMGSYKFRIKVTFFESKLASNLGNLSRFWSRASLVQSRGPIKSSAVCNAPLMKSCTVIFYLFLSVFSGICQAQTASRAAVTPELLSRLTSDFRSATDQKPLRETLTSIASAAQINLWLDRRIDPTQPVSLGAQTKTPYEAIHKAATEAGLSVCPVDNVVIVGRADWVHSLVGLVLSTPNSPNLAQIRWTDASTPTQALASISASTDYRLPHDLWPASSWRQLDEQIAIRLICAQFDYMPSGPDHSLEPMVAPERVIALYPGAQRGIIQQVASKMDPQAKFKNDGDGAHGLRATAMPSAHAAAIDAWIAEVTKSKPRNQKPMDIDRTRFSLKIENAPAEQVLLQLAARCNRQITFDDQALERCAKLITLEATDQSLRSICDQLAARVNVTIQWTDQTMSVTTPR